MRRIIDICWRLCKQVPLLPITILAAIPLALLGEWRPWGEAAWVSHDLHAGFGWLSAFNPGVGQWIVIALVAYTIVVTVRGMIDDLRHGHVGVDLLAVVAIASTVAVQEYWAACACYGQRAYGRRDSRRIPRRQNVRFCRNGQPRRRKAYLRVRISRIGHKRCFANV